MKEKLFKYKKFLLSANSLNVLSTIFLSLGCAFIANFEIDYKNINDWKDIILNIIVLNPYFLIICGVSLLISSTYKIKATTDSLEEKNKNLEEKNKNLEKENIELKENNKALRTELTTTQEECANLESAISLARKSQVGDWLKGLFKQFNLTTHDWVSIYCVVENNTERNFHMVHRYSDNPSLGRTIIHQYPLEKGVIYHAWCHNICHENECIPYEEAKEKYLEYISNKYGYTIDELNKIKMKSCRYLGLSIKEKGDNIGVIVFESTNPNNLPVSMTERIELYCKDYNDYLCGFIKEYISDIDKDNKTRQALSNNDNDKEIYKELKGG